MNDVEQDRPQHRFKAFKRYEFLISQAIAAYPTPIFASPTNLALETVVCRLRDAANAFLKNTMWESAIIDRKKMVDVWPQMECSIHGKKVRVGPRQKRGGRKGSADINITQIEAAKVKELVVTNPTEKTVEALLALHEAGVLKDPTRIKALVFPVDVFEIPPNVEIFPDGDDHIIL